MAGFNTIYAYIKGLNPNAMLGIVQNGYGKSSCTPNDAIGWHMVHLAAGMHEDFAAEEVYNQICCGAQTTSPWVTDGWTYTGVKTMELLYSVATLCALQYINYSNIDLVAFWDSDLYGNFIGPLMDPVQLPAALHFAATQDKSLYCNQNYSQDFEPNLDRAVRSQLHPIRSRQHRLPQLDVALHDLHVRLPGLQRRKRCQRALRSVCRADPVLDFPKMQQHDHRRRRVERRLPG